VDVLVIEDADAITVRVHDTGPGVRDPEQVFRQGYSTKTSTTDGGRGFGLALVRLVCRRRGGDVVVHNHDGDNGDNGAVFTATLPTRQPADRQATP
jgi:signal transduction histidine kinase